MVDNSWLQRAKLHVLRGVEKRSSERSYQYYRAELKRSRYESQLYRLKIWKSSKSGASFYEESLPTFCIFYS